MSTLHIECFFLTLLFMIYKKGVMAIALNTIWGTLFMTFTVMYTSKRYNGYRYVDQIMDLMPIILGCIIMAVSVEFVFLLKLPDTATLGLQVLIGITVYYCYSRVIKSEELKICESVIKNYIGLIQK